MAMIDHRPQLPFGALTAHYVLTAVRKFRTRLARWLEVRRTIRILSQLDQDRLDDLGMTRSDIAAYARRGRF